MRAFAHTVFLVLWAAPMLCLAQPEQEEKNSSGGLRGGFDLSTLTGDDGLNVRSGFHGGLYVNLVKVPIYSLSVGAEYNTAGTAGDQPDHRLSYLNVPLNNRVKLGPVYFDGGLDAGYKLSEETLGDAATPDTPNDATADPWNVMWHLGGGIKFLFLGLEVRYQNGLNEVYPGLRNANLQLGLNLDF